MELQEPGTNVEFPIAAVVLLLVAKGLVEFDARQTCEIVGKVVVRMVVRRAARGGLERDDHRVEGFQAVELRVGLENRHHPARIAVLHVAQLEAVAPIEAIVHEGSVLGGSGAAGALEADRRPIGLVDRPIEPLVLEIGTGGRLDEPVERIQFRGSKDLHPRKAAGVYRTERLEDLLGLGAACGSGNQNGQTDQPRPTAIELHVFRSALGDSRGPRVLFPAKSRRNGCDVCIVHASRDS